MQTRLKYYIDNQALVNTSFYRHYTAYEDSACNCVTCGKDLSDDLSSNLKVHFPLGVQAVSAKVCETCNLLIETKLKRTFKSMTPLQRMEELVNGVYDRFIDHYYFHFPDEEDNLSNNCYACKRHVYVGDYMSVSVPVENSNEYTGGDIKICQQCDSEYYNAYAAKIELGISYRCSNCNNKYTISLEEERKRYTVDKLLKKGYMCPICTHRRTFDISYPYGEVDDSRIRRLHCHCGIIAEVDSMLDFNTILKEHPLTDGKWEWCKKCFLGDKSPIHTYQRNQETSLLLYAPTDGKYPYLCIQRETKVMGIPIRRKDMFHGVTTLDKLDAVMDRVDDSIIPF